MRLKLFLTTALIAIFNLGCGESAYNVFTHDENYYKTLENSSKGEIRDNFDTKAIFSATYLNPMYDEFETSETFLVGVYIPKDFKEKSKQGLRNPFFRITLNDENFYKIKEVGRENEIVKQSPMIDRWSLYYIVEFNTQYDEKLFLKLEHKPTNKEATLSFEKSPQN